MIIPVIPYRAYSGALCPLEPPTINLVFIVIYALQGLEALGYTQISSKTSYLLLAYVRGLIR